MRAVIDMKEIPKCCGDCNCMVMDEIGYICNIKKRYIDDLSIREKWCPILGIIPPGVEVKIIDWDAIERR